MTPPPPPLGEQLKQWRILRGLTQIQAAKRLHVTQTTVSLIEHGHKYPHWSTLEKILKLYKLELKITSLI